jgi:hypothetical protein
VKPNFLIIGAMKSATTSLFDLLSQHPQVFSCSPKEPEFFYDEKTYARGWSWYESLFADARAEVAVGEASTSYTKYVLNPRCAERIARHLPEARLIYIVRHPLKRLESHWFHKLIEDRDTLPLPQAVRKVPHLIDTSLYWRQISVYRRFYSDDRILVLFFEDFSRDPQSVLARCHRFLGLDSADTAVDAERPRRPSAGVKRETWLLPLLRKFPGARSVKALLPGLAARVRTRCLEPINDKPEWDEPTPRWTIEQLSEDSRTFLEFYGKPSNYWEGL